MKIIKVSSCWVCPFSDFEVDGKDIIEMDEIPLFCFATTDFPIQIGMHPDVADSEIIAEFCPLEDA